MNKKIKEITFLLILGANILLPLTVFAVDDEGFVDPLGEISPAAFITKVINFLLGLVGLLALLSLIVGGIHMVGSFGKEDTIAHGKKIILWAIAGLVVVSLAWAILNLVVNQFLGAQ